MTIKQLTNEEFKLFSEKFEPSSVFQTINYAFTMNEQGTDAFFLGLTSEERLIAATLVLVKKINGFRYAFAPKGILIDYNNPDLVKDFTKQMKKFFKKRDIVAIKINPMIIKKVYNNKFEPLIENPNYDTIFDNLKKLGYYHLGYNNFFEALKPRFEAIIDLNNDINILFKNVKKEYRTKIRSAIRNGIKTYKGTYDDLKYLYEFTKDKYKRKLNYFQDCYNFYSKRNLIDFYYTKLDTKHYLETIQKKLYYYEQQSNYLNNLVIKNPENNKKTISKKINMDKHLDKYKKELINATNLLRNFPDGIITSAILVIKQGYEATILIDGYDTKYKKFNSKHLLIWQLIDIYKKNKFLKFNLGGMSNITIDDKKYYGLDKFKLNFGSKMYEYAGDFELVTHKRNYNLYRNYVPLKNLIKSKLIK